jgi:putative SOS response-associated peptidase YedK
MSRLYSFRCSPEEVRNLFRYDDRPSFPPRGHIGPGASIGIVRMERGKRRLALVHWGFIPSWVQDVKPAKPLANARSETVLDKRSFRNAMRRRRCLVPADGFFQWQGDVPGKKQAFHIHRPGHELFAIAGLWEPWMGEDGSEIDTALTITTAANAALSSIHDRMPAVILPQDFGLWLDADRFGAEEAARLLKPISDDYFIAEPISLARQAPKEDPPKESEPDQLKLF